MSHRLVLAMCLLGFNLSQSLLAQDEDPFQFNRSREASLLSTGVILFAASTYFYLDMMPPEPNVLKREKILSWDRFAVDRTSSLAGTLSDLSAGLSLALPLAVAAYSKEWPTMRQDLMMYAESILLMQSFTFLFKAGFHRPRPYAYRHAENGKRNFSMSASTSFFSGHTAAAFNGAVFAGTVFQQRYPDSPWRLPVWIGGLSLATATGILRVTSGNHFPTDVLVGALVGSFTGWLIPHLHKPEIVDDKINLIVGQDGLGVQVKF